MESKNRRERKKTKSKLICIHIYPAERALIEECIPDLNWSEICCLALTQAAKDRKKLNENQIMKC